MTLTESAVMYGTIGFSCGIYLAKSRQETLPVKAVLVCMAIPFWPLLLPILHSDTDDSQNPRTTDIHVHSKGPFAAEIHRTLKQIEEVTSETTDPTDIVLNRELDVLQRVLPQLQQLDQQLYDLEEVLKQPAFSEKNLQEKLLQASHQTSPSAKQSIEVQIQNAQRLKTLHQSRTKTMEEILAMLERIHSQMTLLRFTGADNHSINLELSSLVDLLDGLHELQEDSP